MPTSPILLPILMVIFTGTMSSLSNKALYDVHTQSSCVVTHGFEKPYFLTLCMFLGEMSCLVLYLGADHLGERKNRRELGERCSWLKALWPGDYYRNIREEEDAAEAQAQSHGIQTFVKGNGRSVNRPSADGGRTPANPGGLESGAITPGGAEHVDRDDNDHDDNHIDHDDHDALMGIEARTLLNGNGSANGIANGSVRSTSSSSYGPPRATGSFHAPDSDLLDLHVSDEEWVLRRSRSKPSHWFYFALSLMDLSATSIGGIGLLYVDGSSNQMLRGSSVVFTALLSWFLLGQRFACKQWSGMGGVVGGLALVGACGMLRAHAVLVSSASASELDVSGDTPVAGSAQASTSHNLVSPSGAALGITLILISSVINSIQAVCEELLVKRSVAIEGQAEPGGWTGGKFSIHALELVGWEGFYGSIVTAFVVLPIMHFLPGSNCGSAESIVDTWFILSHSTLIGFLVFLYTFSLAAMNAFLILLGSSVSAVFRQLVNALRVVSIWGVSLMMYYCLTPRTFGESWDRFSYLQLGGFALLVGGTILYGTEDNYAKNEGINILTEEEEKEDREREAAAAAAGGSNKDDNDDGNGDDDDDEYEVRKVNRSKSEARKTMAQDQSDEERGRRSPSISSSPSANKRTGRGRSPGGTIEQQMLRSGRAVEQL